MARTSLVMVRLSEAELSSLDAARGDRKRADFLRSRIPRPRQSAPAVEPVAPIAVAEAPASETLNTLAAELGADCDPDEEEEDA